MNAQPDSLSRPVPSRRRFKTLMEEARRKRRGSVGTALTASTPTLSPSQAGGTDEFHRADAIHIAVPRFLTCGSSPFLRSCQSSALCSNWHGRWRPNTSSIILELSAGPRQTKLARLCPPQTRTSGPTCSTGASGPTCFRLRNTALPWLFARFRRAGPCRPG